MYTVGGVSAFYQQNLTALFSGLMLWSRSVSLVWHFKDPGVCYYLCLNSFQIFFPIPLTNKPGANQARACALCLEQASSILSVVPARDTSRPNSKAFFSVLRPDYTLRLLLKILACQLIPLDCEARNFFLFVCFFIAAFLYN